MALTIFLVSAMLCIGINLYLISSANLENIESDLEILAVPDFYGYKNGRYHSLPAGMSELEALSALPGVVSVDVRSQFGAYAAAYLDQMKKTRQEYDPNLDLIVFTVTGDEDIYLDYSSPSTVIPAAVEWSCLGYDPNVFGDKLIIRSVENFLDNPAEGCMLYHDRSYVCAYRPAVSNRNGKTGEISAISSIIICPDAYRQKYDWTYIEGVYEGCIKYYASDAPLISEYHEGMLSDDPWLAQAVEATRIDVSSFTAIETGDANALPSFHFGDVYIAEGRPITVEEYESKARVCLMSAQAADLCGLSVGDFIRFDFYETSYIPSGKLSHQASRWDSSLHDKNVKSYDWYGMEMFRHYLSAKMILPSESFFDAGEFEIVGIFDGKVSIPFDPESAHFDRNKGMDWRMVLIPCGSVSGAPEASVSKYSVSLTLAPSLVTEFRIALDETGLTARADGDGRQVVMTINDNGTSAVIDGLESMKVIAKVIVAVAAAAALISLAIVAITYGIFESGTITTLRTQGMKKGRILLCMVSALILVCLLCSFAGSFTGNMLTGKIASGVMDFFIEDSGDATFSAMLTNKMDGAGFEVDYGVSQSAAVISALAINTVFMIFVVTSVFKECSRKLILSTGRRE